MQSTPDLPERQAQKDWPVPLPLEAASRPEWPRDVFPEPVNQFVEALAVTTEVPIELPALMVLATLSAAACRRYWIRTRPDHEEPLNVWVCCGLPSGSRKTSVLGRATAPLVEWEAEERRRMTVERSTLQRSQQLIDARIEGIGREVRREALSVEDADRQVAELEARRPSLSELPQLIVEDITPETVPVVMAANGECCALMSDEGGLFDTILGRYSRGVPNLDIYLKGYSASRLTVNRKGRPPAILDKPRLVMGVCPQPDVVRQVIRNDTFQGRGFVSRFLIALPVSTVGYRTLDPPPMPEAVKQAYHSVLRSLLAQSGSGRLTLAMDPAAEKTYMDFGRALEHELGESGILAPIVEWASKMHGNVARIAGILHAARHAIDDPANCVVSVQDVEAAIRLGQALRDHALRAFDAAGAIEELDDARRALDWVEVRQSHTFLRRQCQQALRFRFRSVERLKRALEILEARGYTRKQPRRSGPKGGRPKEEYEVNPSILD